MVHLKIIKHQSHFENNQIELINDVELNFHNMANQHSNPGWL